MDGTTRLDFSHCQLFETGLDATQNFGSRKEFFYFFILFLFFSGQTHAQDEIWEN
jgi:hypothetical protein